MIKSLLKLTILAALGFVLNNVNAQSHSYTPSDSIYTNITSSDQFEVTDLFIYFHNNSTDSVKLTWKFISDNAVPGWSVGLCDNVACYYKDVTNAIYNDHESNKI